MFKKWLELNEVAARGWSIETLDQNSPYFTSTPWRPPWARNKPRPPGIVQGIRFDQLPPRLQQAVQYGSYGDQAQQFTSFGLQYERNPQDYQDYLTDVHALDANGRPVHSIVGQAEIGQLHDELRSHFLKGFEVAQ